MPTISVITPVHAGGDEFLLETYESIRSQRLPAGWSVQWVIQEDGHSGIPLAQVPDAPWISKGSGRPGGAARARTLALLRTYGDLVRCLDADDLFADPDVLARDIAVLSTHADLGWCVAPTLDLHPDGSLHPGPYDPPPGRLPSGFLLASARDRGIPVMGTTMTARTDLVRALGGWPALPGYEDAALLLACEAVSDGWMQEHPGEIYRRHSGQTTVSPEYQNPDEKEARISAGIERAASLANTGWRWSSEGKEAA